MPLFAYPVTVPPNTQDYAPMVTDRVIGFRVINSIGVLFPNGCFNLVGLQILAGGVVIAPRPDGWIRGNDIYLEWLENRSVGDVGILTIKAFNQAEDYSHTPIIYLKVT